MFGVEGVEDRNFLMRLLFGGVSDGSLTEFGGE